MPPEVLLLPRIVLVILGFLLFQMKLSTVLLRSLKNFAGILMGIALNLIIFFINLSQARVIWKMETQLRKSLQPHGLIGDMIDVEGPNPQGVVPAPHTHTHIQVRGPELYHRLSTP